MWYNGSMTREDLESLFDDPGWEAHEAELVAFLNSDFECFDEYIKDKEE